MSNPIPAGCRIRGMGTRLLLVAIALLFAVGAGSARADNPVLTGDVGLNDAFVISLSDAGGAKVTHLDAGTYTLVVHDHSSFHNFHLSGPGVNVQSDVDTTGDATFTVTLVDGTYFFECDPHSSQMKGSFTVGTVTAPPLPGAGRVSTPTRPRASPGKFLVTVHDRSTKDGFRLAGPGVAKSTGARFTGTVTWAVTLRAGTYSYGSVKLTKRRHVFTVSG